MIIKTYKNHRCKNCGYLVKILSTIEDVKLQIFTCNEQTNLSRCPRCNSTGIYPEDFRPENWLGSRRNEGKSIIIKIEEKE